MSCCRALCDNEQHRVSRHSRITVVNKQRHSYDVYVNQHTSVGAVDNSQSLTCLGVRFIPLETL